MPDLKRVIFPEILDWLDPADPRAIMSRRDLRWIDLCLGNSRWIVSQLRNQTPVPGRSFEFGAGKGGLSRKINSELASATVTGLDLIGRPANLLGDIDWMSGDIFQTLPGTGADACVRIGPSPSANRSVRDCCWCFSRSRSRLCGRSRCTTCRQACARASVWANCPRSSGWIQ